MDINTINKAELDKILDEADVIALAKNKYPKVLHRKRDDSIIKIFRSFGSDKIKLHHLYKKSESRYKRNAQRFIYNAMHLATLNIETVKIKAFYLCHNPKLAMVIYDTLPGESVGSYLSKDDNIVKPFALFIANLHNKNVYFRAGHEKNYLYEKEQFKLIDIDNLRFKISFKQRAKNLAYLFYHAQQRQNLFSKTQVQLFLKTYFAATQYSSKQRKRFIQHLCRAIEYRRRKDLANSNQITDNLTYICADMLFLT